MAWRMLLTEDDLDDHEIAEDPHAVYLKESDSGVKNAASGYAGLTVDTKLNLAQMQEVMAHADLLDAPADAHADTKVRTKVVDETAIGDDKILVYKTASGTLVYEAKPVGGGTSHAMVGGFYPGVLSAGAKVPHVPYRGDAWTATKLYCRVAVAPVGANIVLQVRRGAQADATPTSLGTVTITAGTKYANTAISASIADADYFDINITSVPGSPNQGSDLTWVVAP